MSKQVARIRLDFTPNCLPYTVAVDDQAVAVAGLSERLQEARAVAIVVEDRLPPVPASRDVVVSPIELYAWFSGHAGILPATVAGVNSQESTPNGRRPRMDGAKKASQHFADLVIRG